MQQRRTKLSRRQWFLPSPTMARERRTLHLIGTDPGLEIGPEPVAPDQETPLPLHGSLKVLDIKRRKGRVLPTTPVLHPRRRKLTKISQVIFQLVFQRHGIVTFHQQYC